MVTNFAISKADLSLKYRLGLEHALADADFLNAPDLVLVQALTIFLCLVRRHESPRYVWMMTGLAIRMGQAIGLHRDGSHFKHLRPFDVEMRRRAWCLLCVLDVRASEDQGTDNTIARSSYDTKLPLNINDTDIHPEKTETPVPREGITDMSFPLSLFEMCEVTKEMMAHIVKEDASGMEEQSRLLSEIFQKLDRGYLQYSVESGNVWYWVGVTIARLVMAKMTLLVYLPILFSSPSEQLSDQIRSKLLVAAIEVAEHNHALNAEQACRQWRWVYQTYTHWHAVVYILIEICRRPWSPLVERAWEALHSPWLIPAQSQMDKNQRFWVPLRKLTSKARKHRDAELERLRSDLQAAERLEADDTTLPVPTSAGPFPAGSNPVEYFRERWRQRLVESRPTMRPHRRYGPGTVSKPLEHSTHATRLSTPSSLLAGPSPACEPADYATSNFQSASNFVTGQTEEPLGNGVMPWLWASPEMDPSMDVVANNDLDFDGQLDWHDWVDSAKGMEWDARAFP